MEAVTAAAAAEVAVSLVEVAGAADDANHCILQTLFPYDRERTTLEFLPDSVVERIFTYFLGGFYKIPPSNIY